MRGWCHNCQDVAKAVKQDDGTLTCERCGDVLGQDESAYFDRRAEAARNGEPVRAWVGQS